MKNVLKFSGVIAFGLGLAAFILMMATPCAFYTLKIGSSTNTTYIAGTTAIFGAKGTLVDTTLAWNALLAWIFVLVAMLIAAFGAVLPLIKVKSLDKIAALLNLVAIGLFAVAGIFLFFTVPALSAANSDAFQDYLLGVGWVFAAIFNLVAAAFCALPVILQLLKK